jgi:predicted metal-dependent TIM-barrel fold hydrolase
MSTAPTDVLGPARAALALRLDGIDGAIIEAVSCGNARRVFRLAA